MQMFFAAEIRLQEVISIKVKGFQTKKLFETN
jgi:hypothetical protein